MRLFFMPNVPDVARYRGVEMIHPYEEREKMFIESCGQRMGIMVFPTDENSTTHFFGTFHYDPETQKVSIWEESPVELDAKDIARLLFPQF